MAKQPKLARAEHDNPIVNTPANPLKGKVIAIIDADEKDISSLQAACQHYDARLIVSNSEATVSYAVQMADHIMCLRQCPNPRLCEATYENCALSGKEVYLLEDDTLNSLNQNLQQIAVQAIQK